MPLVAFAAVAVPQLGAAEVRDRAGLFSSEAVKKAEAELDRIERRTHIPVVIETIEAIPGLGRDSSASEKRTAVERRARELGYEGVYLLISKNDHIFSRVLVKERFDLLLPREKRQEVRDTLLREFKGGQFDEGLLKTTALLAESLAESHTQPILVLNSGGHTDDAGFVAFSPDGSELISVGGDGTIRFWSVATGETLRVLRPMLIPGGRAGTGALSPDGKLLAVVRTGIRPRERWIYLIALPDGRITKVIPAEHTSTGGRLEFSPDEHTSTGGRLEFSPDGKSLASIGDDHQALLWNVQTGNCERVFRGHRSFICGLTFSPDGRLFATSSGDETARIWSVENGLTQAVLKDTERRACTLNSISFASDGRTLATTSWGDYVRLWNLDGTLRKRIPVVAGVVRFTADPDRLLVCAGKTSFVLDTKSENKTSAFKSHTNEVWTCALSRDGKLAATAGAGGDNLFIWSIEDAKVIHHLVGKGRPIWGVGWSGDGNRIAWGHSGGWSTFGKAHPLERTFDLRTLTLEGRPDEQFERFRAKQGDLSLRLNGMYGVVTLIHEGKDGPTIQSQNQGGTGAFTFMPGDRVALSNLQSLGVYDARTGKRQVMLNIASNVRELSVSPNDYFLLSGSSDEILRIWAFDRPDPLLSLFVAGDDWVAWTPEGYYAASPGGENLMGWQVNNGPERLGTFAPASQFHKSLYRPDVIKLALKTGSVATALDSLNEATKIVRELLPPDVFITSPDSTGARLDKPELTVRAQAVAQSSHPVTAFRLQLDGRPYDGDRGRKEVPIDPAAGRQRTASWQVRLDPGRHRLAVIAESAVSNGQSDEIEVLYKEKLAERPRLYIVAIGVSMYPGLLRLQYAADDARAVESVFRAKSADLFERIETSVLMDKDATRRNIIGKLNWLRQTMRVQDVGLFFFSGHGDLRDGTFYLISVDADVNDLESTAVPAAQLKSILATTKGKLVVLLDACHSGAQAAMLPPRIPIRRIEWSQSIIPVGRLRSPESLLTKFRLLGLQQEGEKQLRPSTDELVRALSNDEHGVITMSSSTGREVSIESAALKHGFFTEALTEGLSGKADMNNDGLVYLTELDAYLVNRVKDLSSDRQHPTTAKPPGVRSFVLSRSRP